MSDDQSIFKQIKNKSSSFIEFEKKNIDEKTNQFFNTGYKINKELLLGEMDSFHQEIFQNLMELTFYIYIIKITFLTIESSML